MKKLMISVLVIIGCGLILTGCSLQNRVASAADTLVDSYCSKQPTDRAVIRLWMDNATTPNQVRITCASDQVNATPQVTE